MKDDKNLKAVPAPHLQDVFQKGLALHQRGQIAQAQSLYRQILKFNENHFDSLHLLGLTHIQNNEHKTGVEYLRRALKIRSDFPEAYYNLGNALLTLRHPDEALLNFEKAIQLNPKDAQYHFERGNALQELNRLDEAIASYENASLLSPRYAEAHNNRGLVLKEIGRSDEALASFDKAISLKPGYAEAYRNRGNALKELKRLDEAVASYDKAISLKPDYAKAYNNRGAALKDLGRLDEALASYNKAISLQPDYAEALNNKAHLLLRLEQFLEGFELYRSRWDTDGFGSKPLNTSIPQWDGESSSGNLLLWAEQGIGDEIFYASMLSLIPDEGMSITVSADKRLHSIYGRSFPNIRLLDRSTQNEPVNDGFAAQAPIGDLGAILKVNADKVRRRHYPYLLVNEERRSELRKTSAFLRSTAVCGVAWKSANKRSGEEKSVRLSDLAPLITSPDISFVNLQYGDVTREINDVQSALSVQVHQIDGLDVFNDIDGLLALIDACDIILTTCNVTAHLAGSIGKKAAVLVPAGKGRIWYWEAEGNSQWYPSLRLVSQENFWDWETPVELATAWIKDNI
jgi:tetratricopeptide (TPR) repeat protein